MVAVLVGCHGTRPHGVAVVPPPKQPTAELLDAGGDGVAPGRRTRSSTHRDRRSGAGRGHAPRDADRGDVITQVNGALQDVYFAYDRSVLSDEA